MKHPLYEYKHYAILNNVVEGKHGHVVAAVLSRAQLWLLLTLCNVNLQVKRVYSVISVPKL